MSGKTKPAAQAASSSSAPGQALGASTITEEKHLAAILPLMSSDHNEWKASIIWAGSADPRTLAKSCYPFFLHNIFVGLVPPFSEFFFTVLEHYQVQALHL